MKEKTEPTSISNENFSFVTMSPKRNDITDEKGTTEDHDKMLQSPVESHFALTPVTNSENSSPANGFTGVVCTDLLKEELDQLEKETLTIEHQVKTLEISLDSSIAIDNLLSPTEENISMFSRHIDEDVTKKQETPDKSNVSDEQTPSKGEVWTLLDCHFGIPLFEVDANTKICDTIIFGGLAESSRYDFNILHNIILLYDTSHLKLSA